MTLYVLLTREGCNMNRSRDWMEQAKSERYPDAHPAGPPRRYYTQTEAQQAVSDAESVVNWCDANLSG